MTTSRSTDNKLAKVLRELRADARMTIIDAQRRSGVSKIYLRQLEEGCPSPNPDVLRRLSDCYGCEFLKLMHLAGYVSKDEYLGIVRPEGEVPPDDDVAAPPPAIAPPSEDNFSFSVSLPERRENPSMKVRADVVGRAVVLYITVADDSVRIDGDDVEMLSALLGNVLGTAKRWMRRESEGG